MESQIQTKIIQYLRHVGAYIVKTIVTNHNGVPDILVCFKGKFIAFEVKQPGKKATELQQYNIDSIQKAGGSAYCVHSLSEVKLIIEKIQNCYENEA